MELTTLLVAGGVLLVILYFRLRGRDPRLPPCPTRPLPFVGHLFALDQNPRKQFKQWRKQYGDIFRLEMAGHLVVVLNGFVVIKEALVQRGNYFTDRPSLFLDSATGYPGTGIVFSCGEKWREQRAVTVNILRDLGFGKNILEEKIHREIDVYLSYLSSLHGQPTDILHQTTVSIANIICSIIIGQRFSPEDRHFQILMSKLQFIFITQQNGSLLNFFPWLKHVPGDIFQAKKIVSNLKDLGNMLKKFVEDKKKKEDSGQEDFISVYLSEMKKKVEAGQETSLNEDCLIKIIMELFSAGTHTTSNTFYWFILYILNCPEVQEKIYSEIVSVVGKDRTPTLQDKVYLNYLNAAIMETQRLASLAPLSLCRMCSEDTTLNGFRMPKGTFIFPNLDSVHHDKKIWGPDVMTFRPERFLDDQGLVKNLQELIPFGLGRRICLGEKLAKMELFLFFASMFQRFKFVSPDPGCPPPLKYDFGFLVTSQPFQTVVIKRE